MTRRHWRWRWRTRSIAAAAIGVGMGIALGSLHTSTTPARAPAAAPTTCGSERWPVKSGTDPDAPKVDLTPTRTTLSALDSMGAAKPGAPQDARLPAELHTYTVRAELVAIKAEADSDYHLALMDGPGTLIAEIPADGCDTGSPWVSQIADARRAVDARLHVTDTYAQPMLPVTVTGVLFYDRIHGQRGVAPNGAELHPVLDLAFG